ncbi:MAG: hypothetical protein ACM33T_03955 [Solirubrobacterales bacterium]
MRTVIGLYDDLDRATDVVNQLTEAGIPENAIGIVTRHGERRADEAEDVIEDKEAEGLATGAGLGAVLGGLGGILVGLGALTIPGIGPVLAAGPIAAGLAGLTGGAVAGSLAGGLVGMGIPEHHAHTYAEKVRQGAILVTVTTSDSQAVVAEAVMNRAGAALIGNEHEQLRARDEEGYSMGAYDEADMGRTVSRPPEHRPER